MVRDLPIGRTLRRFRRLNGIKQCHVAESLGVSQGNLSRWESGTHDPSPGQRDRIMSLIRAHVGESNDAALKRLIVTSTDPLHLICDATHTLLAASPMRLAEYHGRFINYVGLSLWRFASPEIEAAELNLAEAGWFDRGFSAVEFVTSGTCDSAVPIAPGRVRWETLPLADGKVGRLATTVRANA